MHRSIVLPSLSSNNSLVYHATNGYFLYFEEMYRQWKGGLVAALCLRTISVIHYIPLTAFSDGVLKTNPSTCPNTTLKTQDRITCTIA